MRPDLDAVATIVLPTDWSPDQALAVFEILGRLREHLWAFYGMDIQHALSLQQNHPQPFVPADFDDGAAS